MFLLYENYFRSSENYLSENGKVQSLVRNFKKDMKKVSFQLFFLKCQYLGLRLTTECHKKIWRKTLKIDFSQLKRKISCDMNKFLWLNFLHRQNFFQDPIVFVLNHFTLSVEWKRPWQQCCRAQFFLKSLKTLEEIALIFLSKTNNFFLHNLFRKCLYTKKIARNQTYHPDWIKKSIFCHPLPNTSLI